jgi:hypothetical protein
MRNNAGFRIWRMKKVVLNRIFNSIFMLTITMFFLSFFLSFFLPRQLLDSTTSPLVPSPSPPSQATVHRSMAPETAQTGTRPDMNALRLSLGELEVWNRQCPTRKDEIAKAKIAYEMRPSYHHARGDACYDAYEQIEPEHDVDTGYPARQEPIKS